MTVIDETDHADRTENPRDPGGAAGLEAARRLSNDRMAAARVEGTLGVVVEELTEDGLLATAPLPLRDGRPAPNAVLAVSCVLSDTGAGIASSIGQAYGNGGATVEFRMDHAASPHPDARRLQVRARMLQAVGGAALGESVLTDDRGTVLVRARGHFALSFAGSVFESDDLPPPTGLDQALELCDALVLAPADDPADRLVEVPGVLANSRGHLHGGLAIALAQQVQQEMRMADLSTSAGPPRLLSMNMDYLRPGICDGTPLRFRTEYVRRGKRFATLRTEVVRADGRVAEAATGLWTTQD